MAMLLSLFIVTRLYSLKTENFKVTEKCVLTVVILYSTVLNTAISLEYYFCKHYIQDWWCAMCRYMASYIHPVLCIEVLLG